MKWGNKMLWTELCPLKSICWSPTPNVTVFGNRGFFMELRLNEVIRVGPWSSRISVLTSRDTCESLESSPPSLCHIRTLTARKEAFCKPRKRALTRPWVCTHLWFWTSTLQNCEKQSFCCTLPIVFHYGSQSWLITENNFMQSKGLYEMQEWHLMAMRSKKWKKSRWQITRLSPGTDGNWESLF